MVINVPTPSFYNNNVKFSVIILHDFYLDKLAFRLNCKLILQKIYFVLSYLFYNQNKYSIKIHKNKYFLKILLKKDN